MAVQWPFRKYTPTPTQALTLRRLAVLPGLAMPPRLARDRCAQFAGRSQASASRRFLFFLSDRPRLDEREAAMPACHCEESEAVLKQCAQVHVAGSGSCCDVWQQDPFVFAC